MEDIKDRLKRYVEYRIETGGFLRAVLENDLSGALVRADSQNKHRIPEIVQYIFNELPSRCWGSKEKVERWLSTKDKDYTPPPNYQMDDFDFSGDEYEYEDNNAAAIAAFEDMEIQELDKFS